MSVSIRYKGRIADPARIEGLRRDLARFASRVNWECLDLRGANEFYILQMILFPPGRWEPVFFLVDSEGQLHPPHEGHPQDGDEPKWCSVTTQYSPMEEHVQLVQLLRHIRRHHVPNLKVSDEGDYWETGDIERLRSARDILAETTCLADPLSTLEELLLVSS